MKIRKINIIHLNESGKRIATSTFTPHKGFEPIAKDEDDVFKQSLVLILETLKIPRAKLKIKEKKMKDAVIDITTNKGKFYF